MHILDPSQKSVCRVVPLCLFQPMDARRGKAWGDRLVNASSTASATGQSGDVHSVRTCACLGCTLVRMKDERRTKNAMIKLLWFLFVPPSCIRDSPPNSNGLSVPGRLTNQWPFQKTHHPITGVCRPSWIDRWLKSKESSPAVLFWCMFVCRWKKKKRHTPLRYSSFWV